MNSESLNGANEQQNEAYDQWANMTEHTHEQRPDKPIRPEELRESGAMIEQLEKMGVDSRIVSNPAFQRAIKDIVFNSGLHTASLDLEAVPSDSSGERGLKILFKGDQKRYDAHQWDAGEINISVNSEGGLRIDSASVKKEPHGELVNVADATEFSIIEDGSLRSIRRGIYESEISRDPLDRETTADAYYGAYEDEVRTFDGNGIETTRELSLYPAITYVDDKFLSKLVSQYAKVDIWGRANEPSIQGLRMAQDRYRYGTERARFYKLTRKGADSMAIYAYDRASDQKIDIPEYQITDEHGTGQLSTRSSWGELVEEYQAIKNDGSLNS